MNRISKLEDALRKVARDQAIGQKYQEMITMVLAGKMTKKDLEDVMKRMRAEET